MPSFRHYYLAHLLVVASIVVGVNSGYTADSPADARLSADNVDFSDGTAHPDSPLPSAFQSESPPPEYIQAIARVLIAGVLAFANAIAVWTYHNREIIDPEWPKYLVFITVVAPLWIPYARLLRKIGLLAPKY